MSDKPIRAVVHLGIEPVEVPQYARIHGTKADKHPLSTLVSPLASHVAWDQLGVETLESVCKQFRADLYKAAGRELSPECA